MALPIVTKETLGSVKRYFDDREAHSKKAFGDVIDRMVEENPVLLRVLLEYCETFGKDNLEKKKISNCALMVYKLLLSQEESDKMSQLFGDAYDKEDKRNT